jgi:putative oxidoreductase
MRNFIRAALHSPVIEVLFRYVLGATFLYACVHKILHPDAFAKVIYGYKILPAFSINLLAIALPFFELACGLCFMLGIFPRAAAVIANGMLLIFIIAISYNLARGLQFDCGCFTVHKAGVYSDPKELLVRDLLYFLMGLFLIFYNRKRLFCLKENGGAVPSLHPAS